MISSNRISNSEAVAVEVEEVAAAEEAQAGVAVASGDLEAPGEALEAEAVDQAQ